MTNEQIAKVMGWGNCDEFSLDDWGCVKEMQGKMVADGWIVGIEIRPNKIRALIARYCEYQLCPPVKMDAFANTEPAAIVSLFCKVYGIEEK